jgi:CRISPR-associated protein Csb2
MIAISLHFLVGRFHATPWGRHVNEGSVEYPPSPWRLLRTLVATFYRARPAGVTEEQLKLVLAALASSPPAFYLPPAGVAHTRHYDVANGSLKFFDTFLVTNVEGKDELATGAGRTDSVIIWLWEGVTLDAEGRAALGALLRATNTFGRAESWCEAELLETTGAAPNCRPLGLTADATMVRGVEPVRVLAPQTDAWDGDELLEALTIETSKMRKEKQLEPSGASWVTYARPLNLLNGHAAAPHRRPKKKPPVTVVRFALDSKVLPRVEDTLPFCELVRRATIWWSKQVAPESHSELINGKTAEGTRLKGHRHAHFIATDEDGDGRLDHLTLALPYNPEGFNPEEVEAITSLQKIKWHERNPSEPRAYPIYVRLTGLGDVGRFLEQAGAPNAPGILHPSRRWRSVTPFVLPRFATRGAGKGARPRDTPIEQLRREAASRGLPQIVDYKQLERREFRMRPPVRWFEFKTRRMNGTTGYGVAGFEIEFAEDVRAVPIALGFGCHFGLGLFEPVADPV